MRLLAGDDESLGFVPPYDKPSIGLYTWAHSFTFMTASLTTEICPLPLLFTDGHGVGNVRPGVHVLFFLHDDLPDVGNSDSVSFDSTPFAMASLASVKSEPVSFRSTCPVSSLR